MCEWLPWGKQQLLEVNHKQGSQLSQPWLCGFHPLLSLLPELIPRLLLQGSVWLGSGSASSPALPPSSFRFQPIQAVLGVGEKENGMRVQVRREIKKKAHPLLNIKLSYRVAFFVLFLRQSYRDRNRERGILNFPSIGSLFKWLK